MSGFGWGEKPLTTSVWTWAGRGLSSFFSHFLWCNESHVFFLPLAFWICFHEFFWDLVLVYNSFSVLSFRFEFAAMIPLLQLLVIIACVSRSLLAVGCCITVIWLLASASAAMVRYCSLIPVVKAIIWMSFLELWDPKVWVLGKVAFASRQVWKRAAARVRAFVSRQLPLLFECCCCNHSAQFLQSNMFPAKQKKALMDS